MCCQTLLANRQREVPFQIDPISVQILVATTLSCEGERADFITVEFLSDAKMRRLHKKFFRDPSSTDCMSFPIDGADQSIPRHLGDILICPKTALSQAENNPSIFFEELTLYLVHGILHLLGYDDQSPLPRKKMKQREAYIMRRLRRDGQMLSGKLRV